MRFQYLDLFLSTKMEEQDSISEHTATMYGHVFNASLNWTTRFQMIWLLMGCCFRCILAIRVSSMCYHMQEKYWTFSEELTVLIPVKVKANVGEVVDGDGIFDI